MECNPMTQVLRKRERRPNIALVDDQDGEWVDFPPSPAPVAREAKPVPPAPRPQETPAPAQPDTAASAQQNAPIARPRRRARTVVLAGAVLAALAAAAYYGDYWWTVGRFQVSTDDAYVGAKSTTLAAKIPGYIAALEVDDNQRVRAGDVIAR